MSRRYGRNQKRAHRAREAALKIEISNLTTRLDYAQLALIAERRQSFQRYAARSDLYKHATKVICHRLGRELGEQLYPIAKQIWDSNHAQRELLQFDRSISTDKLEIVQISIPELHGRYWLHPAISETIQEEGADR